MPEVRLIDANALYEKVDESQAHNNHQGIAHSVHNTEHAHFKCMIHQAPTIEAEPVRHGRWIEQESPNGGHFNCSECGHECTVPCSEMIDPRDYVCYLDDYCGKCGARMNANESMFTDTFSR